MKSKVGRFNSQLGGKTQSWEVQSRVAREIQGWEVKSVVGK